MHVYTCSVVSFQYLYRYCHHNEYRKLNLYIYIYIVKVINRLVNYECLSTEVVETYNKYTRPFPTSTLYVSLCMTRLEESQGQLNQDIISVRDCWTEQSWQLQTSRLRTLVDLACNWSQLHKLIQTLPFESLVQKLP